MLTATKMPDSRASISTRSTPPLPPPPPTKTPAVPVTPTSIYVKPSSSTGSKGSTTVVVVDPASSWGSQPSPETKPPAPAPEVVVQQEVPRAGPQIEVVDDRTVVEPPPPSSAWKWWVLAGVGAGVGVVLLTRKRR